MIFLYDKKTNEVKAISDKEIKVSNPNFKTKDIKPNKKEQLDIDTGYKLKIVRGKLKTEKPSHIAEKEKKDNIKKKVKEAKTVDELKDIIKTLI